jgi:simple sugar transport system ATP-binding protein
LCKGRYIGTVDIAKTNKEELSRMMVGRDVQFTVDKAPANPGKTVLDVQHLSVASKLHKKLAVNDVSFKVRAGEIVCIAGIDGNGQSEFIQGLTGLENIVHNPETKILLDDTDITKKSIREKSKAGMSHVPEDRHKHGLVLDYTLEQNMVLQRYWEPQFQKNFFIKNKEVTDYARDLIEKYDVRSGQGCKTPARAMSGGNQQKAIVARELNKNHKLLIAVQPTRGLDVGAIEYLHKAIIADRDAGKAVLLVSYELEEVLNLSDRILVMYEGEIVGELNPKETTPEELGLYMAGAKRQKVEA